MKAAIYARVSTTDQNASMQLADLRSMGLARSFEIVGEYVDTISGAKDSRPELNQLMSDARQGKFQAVLVWKLDRFARSLRHLVNAMEELQRYGVDFVSYSDPVDTSTPAGRLMFQIIGAMAEFERELTRERVRSGLANAKRQGRHLGRPKIRFDIDRARELRQQGLGFRTIARELGTSVGTIHSALTA